MTLRGFVVVLLTFAALLTVTVQVSAETRSPAESLDPPGVPKLTDPDTRTHFVTLAVSQLDGDPDFPMLILAKVNKGLPQFVLVVLDARNGKETWSLPEDPPVFFMLFSDPRTVERAYLDEGFVTDGEPSGSFHTAGPDGADELMAKLRERHRRTDSKQDLVI